jgi:hypothetical protein
MNNTYKNAKHPTIYTLFEEAEEQEEDAASKQASGPKGALDVEFAIHRCALATIPLNSEFSRMCNLQRSCKPNSM